MNVGLWQITDVQRDSRMSQLPRIDFRIRPDSEVWSMQNEKTRPVHPDGHLFGFTSSL